MKQLLMCVLMMRDMASCGNSWQLCTPVLVSILSRHHVVTAVLLAGPVTCCRRGLASQLRMATQMLR
jgi:hypothetical protein